MRRIDAEEHRKENPRKNANWLSVITFWYTLDTFRLGRKRDLTEKDLTKPLPEHKSALLGDKISRIWSREVERATEKNKLPSMTRVLIKCFAWETIKVGIFLAIMEMTVRISQPIFLGLLLRYFSSDNAANKTPLRHPMYLWRLFYYWTPNQSPIQQSEAYLYAAALITCSACTVVVLHPYMLAVLHIGMKMRVACCSLIYRKALRMSLTSLTGQAVGNVVTLMSNDVDRFDLSPIFFHYLWIGPVQALFILYFMYKEIQIAAVYGILAIVVFIPWQAYLGYLTSKLRMRTALRTDERVRFMNEIIAGMQVIKMYTWEYPFSDLIHDSRKKEIQVLKYTSFIRGIIMSFIMFTARGAIFLSILSYVLLGNNITAEQVFVIFTYYQILRLTMTLYFPQGVAQVAETSVAIRRVRDFMLTEEADVGDPTPLYPDWRYKQDKGKLGVFYQDSPSLSKSARITIEDTYAKYGKELCLNNINLELRPETLTVLIGPVGGGKSCILQLILRELRMSTGKMKVDGIVSYAAQDAWLFAGSVRQNILFGNPYDRERYFDVVRACALSRDFTLLPYGDRTTVGERGISLSGGQKARVNLARAVYKEADIYLLDDPLSAVDTLVGKQLFEDCIKGYLSNKIVVLVTHQLQFLKDVQQIVIIDDGEILIKGSYDDVQASPVNFAHLLTDSFPVAGAEEEQKQFARVMHKISLHAAIPNTYAREEEFPQEVEEMRTLGAVQGYIYKEYLHAGGNWCVITCLGMMFIAAQLMASFSDYFLAEWVKIEQTRSSGEEETLGFWKSFSRSNCINVYTAAILLTAFFALTRSFFFFVVCMRSSVNLHDRMFQSISRAHMHFFNTNPSGRILNRFSKDLGAVDEFLPNAMIDTLQMILNLLGTVFIVFFIEPFLLIPTTIMCILFYLLRRYYLMTSRSVKRLEGIAKSPVFSHLNATLQGLTTIRSHGAEMILVSEFDKYQDTHSSAWYLFIATSRAFGFWLDCICVTYMLVVTLSFLLISDSTDGEDVGLALTQCIGVTGMFQWGMRQSAELENQMTSVERVLEFTKVEHEPSLESEPNKKPPPDWPSEGRINYIDAVMRYNEQEAPILKGVTFTIEPKEKVGVVGRTGAGKSSLIQALFRLAYVEGEVLVDDINILSIGLHDLRRKISIIPQDPVIFSGTMRYNLDPFNEYHDDALLAALVVVNIKFAITDGLECLNYMMSEGGANLSVGQRQLICLARAIVRNNIILVMDEATANVDPQTDRFIQTTIRTKFSHCTVLTIAHRLHTIMDSDKVLVMDAGKMVEYDHPHILLQEKDGFLASMVSRAGIDAEMRLKQIAEECYRKKQVSEN